MVDDIDPARCPACGGDNRCALAPRGSIPQRGSNAQCGDCWCARVVITSAALARIPAPARGVACLCPTCAAVQEVGRARD